MPQHLPVKGKRKRDVNLAKLAEPQMLTLTELPANRTGFRVIRSATGAMENVPATEDTEMLDFQKRTRAAGTTTAMQAAAAPTKSARVDAGLLTLVLPVGATEDDAANVIEQYGLGDDYAIRSEDGFVSLVRKTEEDEILPGGVEVALTNGMSATVDATMFPAITARADTKEYLSVARMDFDVAHFATLEQVKTYLTENQIDFIENGVEQVDGGVIVHRVDGYDEVGMKLELAPGLVAHVVRGAEDNVPVAIRRAVTDAAFGNFGFGHLDFSAALVDPEFSAMADNAIWQLSDVLQNIVFASGLPLDERKGLINRAADDFSGFMAGLMDAVGDMGFAQSDRGDKKFDATEEETAEAVEAAASQRSEGEGDLPLDATDATDIVVEEAARADEGGTTEVSAEDSADDDATQGEETARTDQEDGDAAKDATDGGDNEAVAREDEGGDAESGPGAVEGGDSEGQAPAVEAVTRKDIEDVVKVALEAAGETFGAALKEIVAGNEKTTKRIDEALGNLSKSVEEIGDTTTVARNDNDDLVVDGDDEGDSGESQNVFKGAFGLSFPGNGRRV